MAFIKGSFLQQGSKVSAFSSTRYIIYIAQKFCEVIVGTEALSVLLMVEVEETNKGLRELLEMLMNNIGEQVHRQVIDTGILPILVKIVKKKTELPVRERTFLLLDALGGASGKFPQYYSAYYDLVVGKCMKNVAFQNYLQCQLITARLEMLQIH
ncbi:hypothetical protein SADUNF_Sadunf19G0022200 [Salix dunnii]|uniref:VHS domain-containing protein n=1 Tax=Salix dunnii TaxID=1413687 RepID=A0A835J2U0_9ROSI|nr:hypothetical protein SADUNF_Sadunf19G0022200 [Salix dunnii]